MHLAVCGLHMRGGVLCHQLESRGATFVREAHTAPDYTMHALRTDDGVVKPALVRHPGGAPAGMHAAAIALEVWDVPDAQVGSFLQCVPAPLGFGTVALAGGEKVMGFIAEGWAVTGDAGLGVRAEDITSYGGWRAWRASQADGKP